jgi:hypothetical protein
MENKRIIFTKTKSIPDEYKPIPASAILPEWYKKMQSYTDNTKTPGEVNSTKATIKKCLPVFDAITAGYLILSPADVYVTSKEDGPWFQWTAFDLIEFHPIRQAPSHPLHNGHIYPKWNNPWSIKTPKGYSTMFTSPLHRDLPFTILTGIVDTDKYTAPVNFPFVLKDPKFEGLIPAGTPIAQVIPIKRDDWRMELGNEDDLDSAKNVITNLRTKFYDAYKNKFWDKKTYK